MHNEQQQSNNQPFFLDVNFEWRNLRNKKLIIHHTIYGADAATAGNYGIFFIAPFTCYILNIYEVHQTAGTDASAVTLNIERLTGTQALDGGDALLSTAFNLKAAINTVQTGTLTVTPTGRLTRQLLLGHRLAMKDSGVLTAVNNVSITVEFLIQ